MDILTENSDCNNTFTQEQKNHILLAKSGTGILSLAMCLIAVSLVFCLRLYKYFTYRLAMYQILSSLCLGVVEISALTLLNYDEDIYYYQIACKTTAFLLEYFMHVDKIIIYNMSCLPLVLFGCLPKKLPKVRNRLCSVFYIVPFTLFMDSFH